MGPFITGSPPGYIPTGNVSQWVFSNPYATGGSLIENAPSRETKEHHIPVIPLNRHIFVDPRSDAKVTWLDLQNETLAVAASLQNLKLKPPSANAPAQPSIMVMVHLPNCLEFVPTLLGVLAAGMTATLTSPALTAGELAWILSVAKPQLIVSSVTGWPILEEALRQQSEESVRSLALAGKVFIVGLDSDKHNITRASDAGVPTDIPGACDWRQLLETSPLSRPVSVSEKEARTRTAVVLWSSGTSGKSKGVCLSHHALNSSLTSLWHSGIGFGAQERWLGLVPFYHVFGLLNVALLAPACGATVILMPKFAPQSFVHLTEAYGVTYLHMAPPVAIMLAKSPVARKRSFRSVTGGMSGGAPLGTEIIEMVYKRLGFVVQVGYGLSEAGSVCVQSGRSWEDVKSQQGSTGPPLYGVELKIVSVQDPGKTQDVEQEGEVYIRSPSLMSYYLNNLDATRESLDSDGWFHTGDVGKVDSAGSLWITDRLKEMIKVKGFQVSPAELEAVLCASHLVQDAGVTSVMDQERGTEYPRAYIVPAQKEMQQLIGPDASAQSMSELAKLGQEIKEWVEARAAKYKWLRGNLMFVQEIPKSGPGKILRRNLKGCTGVEVQLYGARDNSAMAKL